MKSGKYKIVVPILIVAFAFMFVAYATLEKLGSDSVLSENSVTIRLEIDKPSYALGENVKARIYLMNHKNEAVKIEGSVSAIYEVFNSKGESVCCLARFYTLHPDYPIILPPSSETVFPFETFEWNQKTISIDGSNHNVADASPGDYIIKATIQPSIMMAETSFKIKG